MTVLLFRRPADSQEARPSRSDIDFRPDLNRQTATQKNLLSLMQRIETSLMDAGTAIPDSFKTWETTHSPNHTAFQSRQLEASAAAMQGIMILLGDVTTQARLLSLKAGPRGAGMAFAVIAMEAGNLASDIAQANQRIGQEIVNVQSMVGILFRSTQREEDRARLMITINENIERIVSSLETLFNAVQSARTGARFLLSGTKE